VLLTEWEEYRELDLARLRARMAVPVLIDGRNLFEPATAREAGFEYYSIGRS
jgi:UDPglucose 6-dehydrogenase